jgi:histidine phosphotransfer protein HptB
MNIDECLDVSTLDELKMVLEDDFDELINTFVCDCNDQIDGIMEAVSKNDADLIRRAAHSFKGSSGNIGALFLSEKCKNLEDSARDGRLENISALAAEVVQAKELACQLLQLHYLG